MGLTDAQAAVTVVAALAILAGLAGVVVPGLPALPLCWGGVLVWALFGDAGPGRWAVLAAATVVAAGEQGREEPDDRRLDNHSGARLRRERQRHPADRA
jgi:dienelactone hydrolase